MVQISDMGSDTPITNPWDEFVKWYEGFYGQPATYGDPRIMQAYERWAKNNNIDTQNTTGMGTNDPAFYQWMVTTYGQEIADAVMGGNTQFTPEYMYDYWEKNVKSTETPTAVDGTGGAVDGGTGGLGAPAAPPAIPTSAPPAGYHWEITQDEMGEWTWIPVPGTLNANEQASIAATQLEQAKFEYSKEYDKWQQTQQETEFAYKKEQDEKNFQLSLDQMYAELQKNPQNWIVASDFLSKMRPGEVQTLATPSWLSPILGGQPAGTPLRTEGGLVTPKIPSAQLYGKLTPTQRAMLEGYGVATGAAPGDIGSAVQASLPVNQEKAAKWKPAFQV